MNHPPDLSPLKVLALSRLLAAGAKGETAVNVGKDLAPLVEHHWSGREWGDRLADTLDDLESAGFLARIKTGKTTRLALNDEGRRLASETLGIDPLPAKLTWAKLQSDHLSALALGRAGRVKLDLKAEIIRAHYGLDLGENPKAKETGEALAAKLLGLEPGRKFNAAEILRKLLQDAGIEIPPASKVGPAEIAAALLRRELGDPSAKKPFDLLATRSVGARQAKPAELAKAVLQSWVDRSEGSATTEATRPPAAESEGSPDPIGLPEFARSVVEAARTSPTGWFGDADVFISRVWQILRDDPAFRGLDVASFKDRLIEAHRSGLLELGRADLVEAMDATDIRESATPYLNATYHFVRIEDQGR